MMHKNGTANIHPVVEIYAKEHLNGKMDRREFISRATALGVTTAGAYGLIGAAKPATAGGLLQQGGTKVLQEISNWRQIENVHQTS